MAKSKTEKMCDAATEVIAKSMIVHVVFDTQAEVNEAKAYLKGKKGKYKYVKPKLKGE